MARSTASRLLHYTALFFFTTLLSPQFTAAQPCTDPVPSCDSSVDYFPFKPQLDHAKTAKLVYKKTYVDITVTDVLGATHLNRLVRCGCPSPNSTNDNVQVIKIPPARLYIDDSPSLAFVSRSLGQGSRIAAIGDPSRVYSEDITRRIKTAMDLSVLAKSSADIDLAIISPFGVAGYKKANVTVPYFVNGETGEPTPLARGEWIKIFALMFDLGSAGAVKFNEIESTYNNMKLRAEKAQRRPSVLVEYPSTFSLPTTWSMPSQNRYTTELLRDANVDYRFMNDGKNTSTPYSLQNVTKNFKWARYLLFTGQFPSRSNRSLESFFLPEADNATNNAIAINKVLKGLAAVRCGNVWSRTKRLSKEGANDYFELGAIRPDLVLQDIVHAVHPNVDVDNKTTFMFKHEGGATDMEPCPYNELLGEAKEGMVYVDTEMSISKLNRFDVEDKLVSDIIPEVSKDERIPKTNIEAFFEKPQEDNSAVLLLRTMVKDEDSDAVVKDSEKIAEAVDKALGGVAVVKVLSTRKSNQDITVTEGGGLGAGAIAGIIVGALVFVAVVSVILFSVGTKRGANLAGEDLRDRFWNEHGVRLADDVQQ